MQGFRYYGYQMTLTYNPANGMSDLGVRNCAPQIGYQGQVYHHIEDKGVEAEEVCAKVTGKDVCISPRKVVSKESGEIMWHNRECQEAEDWDTCWSNLFDRYRGILSEAHSLTLKVIRPSSQPWFAPAALMARYAFLMCARADSLRARICGSTSLIPCTYLRQHPSYIGTRVSAGRL